MVNLASDHKATSCARAGLRRDTHAAAAAAYVRLMCLGTGWNQLSVKTLCSGRASATVYDYWTLGACCFRTISGIWTLAAECVLHPRRIGCALRLWECATKSTLHFMVTFVASYDHSLVLNELDDDSEGS